MFLSTYLFERDPANASRQSMGLWIVLLVAFPLSIAGAGFILSIGVGLVFMTFPILLMAYAELKEPKSLEPGAFDEVIGSLEIDHLMQEALLAEQQVISNRETKMMGPNSEAANVYSEELESALNDIGRHSALRSPPQSSSFVNWLKMKSADNFSYIHSDRPYPSTLSGDHIRTDAEQQIPVVLDGKVLMIPKSVLQKLLISMEVRR